MRTSRLVWRRATDRFPITWPGGFDPERASDHKPSTGHWRCFLVTKSAGIHYVESKYHLRLAWTGFPLF